VRLHFAVAELNHSCHGWAGVGRPLDAGWPIATKQVGRVEAERCRLGVVELYPRVVVELQLAAVAVSLLVVAAMLVIQLAVCLELEEPEVLGTHRGCSSSSSKVVGYSLIQSCQQVKVRMIAQPVVHGYQKD
jgi:hypothetical protein